MTEQTNTPPRRGPSGGQIVAIVAGSITGILAVLALVVGGLGLYANSKKDSDGYISTGSDPYSTKTYAIASEGLELDEDVPGVVEDLYGKVRIRATSHNGKPVFVGIAHRDDVSGYLARSAHATLTDVNYDPFDPTYRTVGGARRPAPPAEQDIWVASAQGSGTRTLTWDVKQGNWSIVVMNADGSAGVNAGVSAGAQADWLTPAAWGTLGGGLLLAAAAGGLLFAGLRRPPEPPTADQRLSASSVITAS
jgi:hypothetical protein